MKKSMFAFVWLSLVAMIGLGLYLALFSGKPTGIPWIDSLRASSQPAGQSQPSKTGQAPRPKVRIVPRALNPDQE